MRLNRVTLATFMIMATFGNTSFIGFSYIDAFMVKIILFMELFMIFLDLSYF